MNDNLLLKLYLVNRPAEVLNKQTFDPTVDRVWRWMFSYVVLIYHIDPEVGKSINRRCNEDNRVNLIDIFEGLIKN